MRKYWSIFFFFLLSLVVSAQPCNADSCVIATVNNVPICVGEYNLLAAKLKFKALELRKVNSQLDAEQVLRKMLIDSLVSIKIQQILAKDCGIINAINYTDFLISLDVENKRRHEAKETGTVIFGPIQYSTEVFFDYTFSNMVIKLKDHLTTSQFDLSERKLQEIYHQQKETRFRQPDYIKIQKISVENAKFKSSASALRAITQLRKNLIKEKYVPKTTVNLHVEQLIFNPNQYLPEDSVRNIELNVLASKLTKGGVSEIVKQNENYVFFQVLERHSSACRSFSTCHNYIKTSELDKLYSNYIKALTDKAIIVLY